MCGIAGRVNYKEAVDRELFLNMRDTLVHRGPDDAGVYFGKTGMSALGHRRLSIVDLSETGRQPIHNEDKTLWLVANGEIYNAAILRAELENSGHRFYTQTDSEVILHGYELWGRDVLEKLEGMFAFAILDCRDDSLFLARDRFGIKPLFYYSDTGTFIFASELKAIIKDPAVPRKIDTGSFSDFFIYRFVPSPMTIWENIYKLPPAHCLEVDKKGRLICKCYWKLTCDSRMIPEKEAVETAGDLIRSSMEKHLMSDVPVGLFLSGGYDSTAIAYYLEQLHYNSQAFSVGFPGWKGSEHQFARIVAEKFSHKHNELMATEEDYGLLEKLMFHYDDPIADISIIPTFLVSRFASEKVKTVLSGEGADEIFGGYSWYKTGVRQPYKQSVYDSGQRMLKGIRPFSTEHYAEAMAMGMFGKKTLREMLGTDIRIPEDPFHFYRKTEPEGITGVKAFQFRDIRSFMGELVLTKVDRASMANSLEVRVPFLDHRIAEFVLRLDENIYHKKNITKFLLHENIKDKVPAEILKRPKQGFTGPDSFYGNFNLYREILNDSVLVSDQYIQKEFVISALQRKDKWRLWKLAVMETWYRKWK